MQLHIQWYYQVVSVNTCVSVYLKIHFVGLCFKIKLFFSSSNDNFPVFEHNLDLLHRSDDATCELQARATSTVFQGMSNYIILYHWIEKVFQFSMLYHPQNSGKYIKVATHNLKWPMIVFFSEKGVISVYQPEYFTPAYLCYMWRSWYFQILYG